MIAKIERSWQGACNELARMSHGCRKEVARTLQECRMEVARRSQGCKHYENQVGICTKVTLRLATSKVEAELATAAEDQEEE